MRVFRLFLIMLVLVLGGMIAAAWVLPGMLDWNRYRGTIEGLASIALGRPVQIEGPITLELLPDPLLTAASVSINSQGDGRGDAKGGVAISARELRLRIAPAALLAGTIDARELVLRDPVMRVPWPLPPGTLGFHRPPWLTALDARIEGGTLSIGAVTFTGIDATLSAGDADGGYRLAGTAEHDGAWRFTARLSGLGGDGAAGVDLTLDGVGDRQGLGARFSGQRDGAGMLAGRLDGQGPDLSRLLPAPAVPFRAGGRLTLASGLLAADDLALDIGGSPARGAIALRLEPQPRLDLALAASRLDLDAWLPALLKAPAASYPVGVDLSAEAAQLFGGSLRRLRVAFDVAPSGHVGSAAAEGDVFLREARAILPGEANLELTGKVLRADPARSSFAGDLKLTAPDFRTTLHWLKGGVLGKLTNLPPAVLREVDIAGKVVGDPQHVLLNALHGTVDGMAVEGTIAAGFGPRLALTVNLGTDRFALDPWLPADWSSLAADPTALLRLLPAFDLDLRLSAKRAAYHGVDFAPLAADLAIEDGRLRLRHVDTTVQGAQLHLGGALLEGGRIDAGQLSFTTKDAAMIPPWLPPSWRLPGLWRGAARCQLDVAGPPTALAVKLAADLGDLRLEAQPTLDLTHQSLAGALTLRHPGAPRLLETLGVGGAAAWLGDGSFSLVAGLAGTLRQIRLDKLELVAGSLRADAALLLEAAPDAEPHVSGKINFETLPLPDIYLRSPEPLPMGWLRSGRGHLQLTAVRVLFDLAPALEQAQAGLSLEDGLLRVDGLTATLSGGTLTGSLGLLAGPGLPLLQIQASLAGVGIADRLTGWPLDLSAGQLSGDVTLIASGHSPAALLATLEGHGQISVRDGVLVGVDYGSLDAALQKNAADPALAMALAGGASGFSQLDAAAEIARGRILMRDAQLQSASGKADFTGSIDIAGAALDMRISLRPDIAGSPDIGLRLTGPLEAARRIPEFAGITTWRAQLTTH